MTRQQTSLPADVPEGTRADFVFHDGLWRLVRFTIPLPTPDEE